RVRRLVPEQVLEGERSPRTARPDGPAEREPAAPPERAEELAHARPAPSLAEVAVEVAPAGEELPHLGAERLDLGGEAQPQARVAGRPQPSSSASRAAASSGGWEASWRMRRLTWKTGPASAIPCAPKHWWQTCAASSAARRAESRAAAAAARAPGSPASRRQAAARASVS